MRFSLIVCTLGRTAALARLLESLATQTHRDVDVCIVDQNDDERVNDVLQFFDTQVNLTHIRSASRGAARARNVGLARALSGDIVAFPDDDCIYPPDLLERVVAWLRERPEWDALTGRSAEDPYWASKPGRVTRYNVWKRGIEYTIFLRHAVVAHVGLMDETLGVGAGTPWGAGEGTDYLLRALAAGFQIYFDPSIEVAHPRPEMPWAAHVEKSYRYAVGKGRVLRLHRCPLWFNAYQCARPLAGAAVAMFRGQLANARTYLAVYRGIRDGWRAPLVAS